MQLFLMAICSKLCLHFHLKMDLEVSLVKKVYQQVYNPTKRCHIQALPAVHVQQSREEFVKTAAKTLFSTQGFVKLGFVKLGFVKLFSTKKMMGNMTAEKTFVRVKTSTQGLVKQDSLQSFHCLW